MTNIQINTSQRLFWIDVLRIILALSIAILHYDWKLLPQAYLSVEMFFMLSGIFFIFQSTDCPSYNWLMRNIKRTFNVWQSFISIFIIFILCVPPKHFSSSNIFDTLLGWSYIGLGNVIGPGAYWFIGVYIYVSIIYILVFHAFSRKTIFLYTFCIVLIGLALLYNQSPAHNINLSTEILCWNFSFGFWRGLVGFGVGILLGPLLSQLQKVKIRPVVLYILGISFMGLSVKIFKLYPPTAAFDYLWYVVGAIVIAFCYLIPNPSIKSFPKFFQKLPLSIYLFPPILIVMIKNNEMNISWVIYLLLVFFGGIVGVYYMRSFSNSIKYLFFKCIKQ